MTDFNLACLELKQNGKGFVKNYDQIEDEGKCEEFHTTFKPVFLVTFFHKFYSI